MALHVANGGKNCVMSQPGIKKGGGIDHSIRGLFIPLEISNVTFDHL